MPPGVLFTVYDSKNGNTDYITPEYCDITALLDELVEYVKTIDDHPLIVSTVVYYQCAFYLQIIFLIYLLDKVIFDTIIGFVA